MMDNRMDQPISKADKWLFEKIDTESKQVRTIANKLDEALQKLSGSYAEVRELANQMKTITTVEIMNLPTAIQEAVIKIQKLNAKVASDSELAKQLMEFGFDWGKFTKDAQEFSLACIQLSVQAEKLEAELNS